MYSDYMFNFYSERMEEELLNLKTSKLNTWTTIPKFTELYIKFVLRVSQCHMT